MCTLNLARRRFPRKHRRPRVWRLYQRLSPEGRRRMDRVLARMHRRAFAQAA